MLTIETDIKMNRKKAVEFANVLSNMRAYVRKPEKKYDNYILSTMVKFFIWIVVIISFYYFAYFYAQMPNVLLFICFLILTVGLALIVLHIFSWIRLYRIMKKNKNVKEIFEFDKKKIDNHVENEKDISMRWSSVSCIRIIKEHVYIIPKTSRGYIMALDKKYFEEIKTFIKNNDINVKILD